MHTNVVFHIIDCLKTFDIALIRHATSCSTALSVKPIVKAVALPIFSCMASVTPSILAHSFLTYVAAVQVALIRSQSKI